MSHDHDHHALGSNGHVEPGDYWFQGAGWPRKLPCTVDETHHLRFSATSTPVCVDCLISGEFTPRADGLPLPESPPF